MEQPKNNQPPQDAKTSQLSDQMAKEYESALQELTFNSKPLITSLTMIAGENPVHAKDIADKEKRLPILYLVDSIIKNVGGVYKDLFNKELIHLFWTTFSTASIPIKNSLIHLLSTWNGVVSPFVISQLNAKIQTSKFDRSSSSSSRTSSSSQPPSLHPPPSHVNKLPSSHINTTTTATNATIVTNANVPNATATTIHVNPKFVNPSIPVPIPSPIPSSTPIPSILPVPLPVSKPISTDPKSSSVDSSTSSVNTSHVTNTTSHVTVPSVNDLSANLWMNLGLGSNNLFGNVTGLDYSQIQMQVQQQIGQILADIQMKQMNGIPFDQFEIMSKLQKLYQMQQQLSLLHLHFNSNVVTPPSLPPHSHPPPPPPSSSSSLPSIPPLQPISDSSSSLSPIPPPHSHPPPPPSSDQSFKYSSHSTPSPSDPWSPEALKIKNEIAVKSYYDVFPLQCKNCGLRFVDREKLDKHLDWHFLQNRREKEKTKKAMSRNWFLAKEDWLADFVINQKVSTPFAFTGNTETKSPNANQKRNSHRVPADESQKQCPICGEKFEEFYDEHEDEWVYLDTTLIGSKIYHYSCFSNSQPHVEEKPTNNDDESENDESESEEEHSIILDENVNIPSKRSLDETIISSISVSDINAKVEQEEQDLKRAKIT